MLLDDFPLAYGGSRSDKTVISARRCPLCANILQNWGKDTGFSVRDNMEVHTIDVKEGSLVKIAIEQGCALHINHSVAWIFVPDTTNLINVCADDIVNTAVISDTKLQTVDRRVGKDQLYFDRNLFEQSVKDWAGILIIYQKDGVHPTDFDAVSRDPVSAVDDIYRANVMIGVIRMLIRKTPGVMNPSKKSGGDVLSSSLETFVVVLLFLGEIRRRIELSRKR